MTKKELIYNVIKENYTGRFEFRLNDKNPKLLFENTLGFDFLLKINGVSKIIKTSATEKNSVFYKIGFGQIVYVVFEKN